MPRASTLILAMSVALALVVGGSVVLSIKAAFSKLGHGASCALASPNAEGDKLVGGKECPTVAKPETAKNQAVERVKARF